MSRCLETSSTTQVAKNHGENLRTRGTPWTKLVRSSISHIAVGETIRRSFIRSWMGKIPNWECMFINRKQGLFLSVSVGWHQSGWKEAEYGSYVEEIDVTCGYWRTRIISWPCALGMHSAWMQTEWNNIELHTKMFESRNSARTTEKLLETSRTNGSVVLRHGGTWSKKYVERYCELANKKVEQLHKVSHPCLWMIINSSRKNSKLLENGQKFVRKWSWNACSFARIGRLDILWTVNKLARSVAKWTQACDRRLARPISSIHHAGDHRQYCHVGSTAKHCRLGLFQDSGSVGDLEVSTSTSGGTLCVFGSHTFVPVRWVCKKHTAAPHSPTESEVISLDAGLRVDGDLLLICGTRWLKCVVQPTTMSNPNIQTTRKLVHFLNPKPRRNMSRENRMLTNWVKWITYSPTHILLKDNPSCTFLKTLKLWSKCWSSHRSPTSRRSHRVALSIWNPRSKSKSFVTCSGSHSESFLCEARKRIVIGAMSKRGQDTTSSDGSPVAKARSTNLVMCSHSPQSSGFLVNPGKDDERERVGQVIPTQTSKLEIPKSIGKGRSI